MSGRILILGIGNPLMGDEGVGVRVAEALMRDYTPSDDVEILDAGTMGLGMMGLFRERDLVIVVDAVDHTGHEPGTVVIMTPEELAPTQVLHSLHDLRLVNVLEAASLTGIQPDVICVGVQVTRIEPWVTSLTPAVDASLPAAVSAVLDLLSSREVELVPAPNASVDASVIESIRTRAEIPASPGPRDPDTPGARCADE
ncbi:MAG TPA: HyaD/HybD family hydrogenase maturation endopeptidase [Coriobacteriia bacterium]|nr:HyaD/HybD family hydrogenase maturation endopeptidase [Coriobacteriia bacterium]